MTHRGGELRAAPLDPAEPRSVGELSRDAKIPAHRLRKRSLEQVFVTDWMRGPGDDYCTIAAQLPLVHARFSDTATPYHDIMLIAEVMTQAGLVSAWTILGVTPGQQFLVRELRVSLDPLEHNRRTHETCDLTIAQDSSSDYKTSRGGRMVGGILRARCAIAGRNSGFCEVIGAWLPEEAYDSLRKKAVSPDSLRDRQPEAARELRTGKLDPRNSVITELSGTGEARGYAAKLLIDPDDPTFFDPAVDHVPGLLLLEGLQQASVAAACDELAVGHDRVKVVSIDMKFTRFNEFTPEVTCGVQLDEDARGGSVSCWQGDKQTCSGTVGIAIL